MAYSRDEQIQDGEQLQRIKNDLGPIERLLKRKKDDLFQQWSNDQEGTLSRDFCKGALSVIDSLMAEIDEMIDRVPELEAERAEEERQAQELAQVRRSPALEGGGYGDLAS